MTEAVAGGPSDDRWPGPIADDLLRAVLAASRGSLPRYLIRERAGAARRLDVVLRAALFCDLARAGLVVAERGPVAASHPGSSSGRVPVAQDTVRAEVEADRILTAVLAAVARRPGVSWTRWFRHVRQDRAALVSRLVASGRWTAQGANRFLDRDPGGAERLATRMFTVSELIEAPSDGRETVLGYLYALSGLGLSTERALGWDVRLAGLDETPDGATTRAVLAAARSVIRRGRFGRR